MFKDVHTQVLVCTSGDFPDFCNRLFGKGLLEMIDDDGLAHGDAIIDKITDETAQSQYHRPRQMANEKTDAQQGLILQVVPHPFQRLGR